MIKEIKKKLIGHLKLTKKAKGSFAVEATLIFPLIMFIMFALIYLTIIHYQNNVMIAESIRAMNRAGAYWQYIDMGMVDEKNMFGKTEKTIDYIDYTDKTIPFPFDDRVPAAGIINFRTIAKRNAYRSLVDVVSEAISKISKDKIQLTKKKANASKYVESRVANVKFKQYEPNDENDEVFTNIGAVTGSGFMFFGDDLKVDVGRSYINPMQNLAITFFSQNSFMSQKNVNRDIKVSSVISNQAEFVRNIDSIYDLTLDAYNLVKSRNN